jgi:hypothetical protein
VRALGVDLFAGFVVVPVDLILYDQIVWFSNL